MVRGVQAGRFGMVALALALVWLAGAQGGTGWASAAALGPGERAAAQVAPLSPPVTVKIGLVPTTGTGGTFLAQERGYFREEGLDVQIENFDTGSQMVPLLGTGQLDAASGAVSAGLFNAVLRGIPLRFVATSNNMAPGHGIVGIMVRTDLIQSGAFRDYADLRGLRVAIPARASATEEILDAALVRGGLSPADVDVTEIPLPDITAALANRSIDVGLQTEPTATASAERGVAVRWRTADELTPGMVTSVWAYSPIFIEQKPEAGRRWMVGYLRGVRDYVNAFERGVDREAVIQTLIRYTPLKDRAMYDRIIIPAVAPDGYIDPDALQNDLAWYVRRGYVGEGLTARELIDNQFADYAIGRLGRYQ